MGLFLVESASSVFARSQNRKVSLSEEPSASSTCALSVSTADTILLPGESTSVEVWARFPSDAYAFASSAFDVAVGFPGWSYASDGAIAGNSVLGILAEQNYQPFVGVLADPANPLRLWTGEFTPDSYEPRLVTIEAIPNDFWYYPSELTSSDASCVVLPGKRSILINPIRVGEYAAAPGEGTELTVSGEGPIDLVAESRTPEVLISLISPAVMSARARTRIDAGTPDGLKLSTEFDDAGGGWSPTEITLNYEKIRSINLGYTTDIRWPEATDIEYQLTGPGRVGQRTSFAAGGSSTIEFNRYSDGEPAPFVLSDLPDTYQIELESNDEEGLTAVLLTTTFDIPVQVTFDSGRTTTVEKVKRRMSCSNNFKQIGLAVHSFGAVGTSKMTVAVD